MVLDGEIQPTTVSGPSADIVARGLLLQIRAEWANLVDREVEQLEGFICLDWSIRGLLTDTVTFSV